MASETGSNRAVVLARRPEGTPAADCFRVEEEPLAAPLPRHPHERPRVIDVAVDPTVGYQPHQVHGPAAARRRGEGLAEGGVPEERPVLDGSEDLPKGLPDGSSRSEAQVADLGVPHVPGGEPHRRPGGVEAEGGETLRQLLHVARVGVGDSVVVALLAQTPAIEDDQDERESIEAGWQRSG